MGKWYGNVSNRIDEGKQFVKEIKVGDGMTEYLWSDRHAYEVTRVESQEHVWVRRMRAKCNGAYSNNWTYTSDDSQPEIELVKRNNGWNKIHIYQKDRMLKIATDRVDRKNTAANPEYDREKQIEVEFKFMLCHCNFTDSQRRRFDEGKEIKKYEKYNNISFGVMDEYFDYEF